MSLRQRIKEAVEKDNLSEIEQLVSLDPRAIRYLVGMTYHPDENIRRVAARGVGLSSNHHPKLISKVIRRLIWAMNDESGTNALTAPAVILEIAKERSELLLPVVPDLLRLATDEGLHAILAQTLNVIKENHPGEVGKLLNKDIGKRFVVEGENCGCPKR
jgi:hypothetical protein